MVDYNKIYLRPFSLHLRKSRRYYSLLLKTQNCVLCYLSLVENEVLIHSTQNSSFGNQIQF